jgi:hypothetical protein
VKGSASPRLPLAVLCILLAWDASPQSADPPGWKGTREIRDGVVYVSNPAEPAEGRVEYELQEVWRIPSETADDSLIFGVVEDVAEDHQGNVLVLDGQLLRVLVISPTGKILRTMGRAGDGPGELRKPARLCVRSDGSVAVLEPQAHRGVLFNEEGIPLREWRLELDGTPGARILAAVPTKNLYAVALMTFFAENDELRRTVVAQIFSSDGVMQRELVRQYRAMPRTRPPRNVEETGADLVVWDADDDGRVLVSPTWRDYTLDIYDAESGALRMVVTRAYEPLARTPEEIEEQREYFESYYGGKDRVEAVVSPVYRTIVEVIMNSDGTTWVCSSRGWKQVGQGVASRYDVFDREGRYIREAVLLGHVSPDDDEPYLIGSRFVNVAGRDVAATASVGMEVGQEREAKIREAGIICYRLVRREDDAR